MIRLIVSVMVLATAFSLQAAESFRVATFNVHWRNREFSDIQDVITKADADVVCIQESTREIEQQFQQRLNAKYPYAVFVGHKGEYSEERLGFLSKSPLNNVQYEQPVHGLFGSYCAELTYREQVVRIVNVHLSPFVLKKGASLRQAFRAISDVEKIHEKEIVAICDLVDPEQPTFVCGDFNSPSTFVAPSKLVTLGLSDSFAKVNKHPDSQPTWRWPLGKQEIKFRIDYIFNSDHFETVSSKIHSSKGSDHSLLVSAFSLKTMKGNGE